MLTTKISEVMETARFLVRDVTTVKPGEQVLIVGDYESDPIALDAMTCAAIEAGAEPSTIVIPPRLINGDPFPSIVASAVTAADVIFGAASRDLIHSLVWGPGSKLRDKAERTWRYVDMTQASAGVMTRPGARASLAELERIGNAVFEALKDGERIRITSKLGTDISGLMRGVADAGLAGGAAVGINKGQAQEEGSWCCFPDGEVYVLANGCIGRRPGDAEGVIVFDTAMHMLGLLREPIKCMVENGLVTDISGGWQAKELRRILDIVPNSNNIIELGSIATNPDSTPHGESMYEDRKSIGTIHIAVGNRYVDMYNDDATYRPHFVHLDGVISKPTVYVDGTKVMDEGRLLCL